MTEDELVELSRQRIERGSKSFAGAARLFDRDTRASAYMLYAWCRHCDDEIDGQELGRERIGARTYDATPESARRRLEALREKTERALAGRPDEPVFEALHRVVEKHAIPREHPLELIEGFRMDVDGHRYERIEDTLAYAYHVAGCVGVMMAMIMGVRHRDTLNRASDLGIAFQLTNIARDIVPDAAAGRVYLPSDWLAAEDLTAGDLERPEARAQTFRTAARLLDLADRYYQSAHAGIPELPPRAAWAVAAARNIYRDIGQVIRERGPAAWDERAYVGRNRKLIGFARAGTQVAASRIRPSRKQVPNGREGLWTRPGLGDA